MEKPDEPFVLFVYKHGLETWPHTGFVAHDDPILCRPWKTELPQIGHTILFEHNNQTFRAKIIGIEWYLGNEEYWMLGSAIHIYATVI